MKLKKTNTIFEAVRIELIREDELLYFSDCSLVKQKKNTELWKIKFNSIPITNFIDKNDLTLYSINTDLYKLNLDAGTTSLIRKCEFYPISKFNNCLLGHRFGKFYIVNFETQNIITSLSYKGTINCIYREIFIIVNITNLLCYSILNGIEYWNNDLSEKSKYQDEKGNWHTGNINKVEVFEDTLVVLLGNDVLVGLDLATGSIKWELVMPIRILTPAAFNEGKIYWFALGENPVYQIIDIEAGIIEKSIVPPLEIINRLTFTKPFVYNNWLLMTSVSTHEIFIVEKQTLKVVDITKIEGCKNRIPIDNSPQVAGNIIYQLDGDCTLHVFEMENL